MQFKFSKNKLLMLILYFISKINILNKLLLFKHINFVHISHNFQYFYLIKKIISPFLFYHKLVSY